MNSHADGAGASASTGANGGKGAAGVKGGGGGGGGGDDVDHHGGPHHGQTGSGMPRVSFVDEGGKILTFALTLTTAFSIRDAVSE